MRRDQLNDEYLELLDKQRLYFKTVKDFKEVRKFCSYDELKDKLLGGGGGVAGSNEKTFKVRVF